jgi:hypothetical protein
MLPMGWVQPCNYQTRHKSRAFLKCYYERMNTVLDPSRGLLFQVGWYQWRRAIRAGIEEILLFQVRNGVGRELFAPPEEAHLQILIDGLQFFPRLKPHCLAWWDRDFRSGARVAPNSSLARTHVEHAKSAEFNAIAARQCLFHALKNSLYRELGFGLGDARLGDDFVDDVKLDHSGLPGLRLKRCLK